MNFLAEILFLRSNNSLITHLQSFSSISVLSPIFLFSLLCFHLDWSVEHFVSLLSNHFKNTHTHTHTHTHSLLLWRSYLLLWMWEQETLLCCSQIVFPQCQPLSHTPPLIEFTSGLSGLRLEQPRYSPPPHPTVLLCCFCARSPGQTANRLTSRWHLVTS